MTSYSTPGVYVEEVTTFPPSVAEVSTAIPVFIGYTEKAPAAGKVVRINTLLEYEAVFGKAQNSEFTVSADYDGSQSAWNLSSLNRKSNTKECWLYYCLDLYFKNGGGSCYVVSVGGYSAAAARTDFETGLALAEQEDEPTLIVFPDALNLSAEDYHAVCEQALAQCKKLGDRFAILDLPNKGTDPVDEFRNGLSAENLEYGAAYHPFLNTSLNYHHSESGVSITSTNNPSKQYTWQDRFGPDGSNGIVVSFKSTSDSHSPTFVVDVKGDNDESINISVNGAVLTITGKTDNISLAEIMDAWTDWLENESNNSSAFSIELFGEEPRVQLDEVTGATLTRVSSTESNVALTLQEAKSSQTGLYNQVKTALQSQRIVLPPSAAVAGVYASVDRDRGVWKAPANIGLASVIGPVTKVTDDEQGRMNVDTIAGKSVNAIRAFTGKGTLVWGARTLAGNDNEWRYVSVRRLFNLIEESTRKATSFAVFEPNNATTWLKVKAMIDSYLFSLWERGALAGATSEDAYYVNVGLGKTMTPQDVLEGKMVIEIGVAAVRPAEFVVLRFSHILQES